MTTSPDRLLLLDSASLYFRAFYGVPDRRSDEGVPTNALSGFLDMLATLVNRERPSHLVCCWDDDWRPAFRTDAIPSYKAHRVLDGADGQEDSPENLTPQVPLIVEALGALGIARVGVPGYEADDVIGSYADQWAGRMPIDVVTGDRDLFQLVDDAQSTRVLYTARGGVREPDVVDQSFLQAKYGVPTGRAYCDMAVLRGDTSDGLPGVVGIGEKTAATLLARYGDLRALRAAVDSGDPELKGARRTRLEEAGDYLDKAPGVVEVVRTLELPKASIEVPHSPADPGALDAFAARHGVQNSVRRVVDALAD